MNTFNQLPLQLGTLGLVGLVGSLLRGYQENGFSVNAIITSFAVQIIVPLAISFIAVWFIKSKDLPLSEDSNLYIIAFTWIYFALGIISFLQLVI